MPEPFGHKRSLFCIALGIVLRKFCTGVETHQAEVLTEDLLCDGVLGCCIYTLNAQHEQCKITEHLRSWFGHVRTNCRVVVV